MIITKLKSIALAATLALGVTGVTGGMAFAGGEARNITLQSENLVISIGNRDRDRRHRGGKKRGHKRDFNRFDRGLHFDFRPRRHRVCTPGRALRKAENRGLRRAHIRRVTPNRIVVAGRIWGERVRIGFGRHRSCPVRFVRAR